MKKTDKEQQTESGRRAQAEVGANAYAVKRARRLARGKKYGLRTEFHPDCTLIMAILSPWLLSWKEANGLLEDDSHVDPYGKKWSSNSWCCDTDVQFVVAAHGPKLNELQWLIGSIVDLHVAAQTVAPLEAYTGERLHYAELEKIVMPPNPSMLKKAIKALREKQETYAMFSDFHQETIEKCNAALGDEEPYKRRVAKRCAEGLSGYLGEMEMDSETLEKLVYKYMTFDKSVAHISLPTG